MKTEYDLKQKLGRLLSPLNAVGPRIISKPDDWMTREDIETLVGLIDQLGGYKREALAARNILKPNGKEFVESPPLELSELREWWCGRWDEYETTRYENTEEVTWRT